MPAVFLKARHLDINACNISSVTHDCLACTKMFAHLFCCHAAANRPQQGSTGYLQTSPQPFGLVFVLLVVRAKIKISNLDDFPGRMFTNDVRGLMHQVALLARWCVIGIVNNERVPMWVMDRNGRPVL